MTNPTQTSSDSLTFNGCWNDAYPRQLARDGRLSAIEVRVWLILKMEIQENQAARFPDYDDILTAANLGSRSTLSKALKILQATRWLFVATRRDAVTGQVQGNEYALQDSPASISETCQVNGGYIDLLEQILRPLEFANENLSSFVEIPELKDLKGMMESLEILGLVDLPVLRVQTVQYLDHKVYKVLQGHKVLKETMVTKVYRDLKEILEILDLEGLKDQRETMEMLGLKGR